MWLFISYEAALDLCAQLLRDCLRRRHFCTTGTFDDDGEFRDVYRCVWRVVVVVDGIIAL
jgi:hypothetical protein